MKYRVPCVHLGVMFASLLTEARVDKNIHDNLRYWSSEWMLIASFPTEDKSQMLLGVSGLFVQRESCLR